jgi:hypothetical protein
MGLGLGSSGGESDLTGRLGKWRFLAEQFKR